MKIAMLANANVGHTIRWANALAGRGLELHLLTCHAAHADLLPQVRVHRLLVPARLGYFLNAPQVRRLLERLRPDLLHTHYATGYGTLARLCGYRPLLLSVWGSDVYRTPDASAWKRRQVVRNLAAADWVCSTSEAMAERTRGLCPAIHNLSVTPFGVETDRFLPRRVQPDDGTLIIGTVKKLAAMYGIDVLIQGFAQCRRRLIQERHPIAGRLRLRIVGGGPEHAVFRRLAHQEGIGDVTEFVGPVAHQRVPEELNKLDIYVAVSRQESFGVAVIEASSCGVPVVVSDVGGLPEVVVDGVTGFIVPSGNPASLAAALVRLVIDPALRCRLGDGGREFVLDQYRWEESVDRMLAVYQSLLSSRRVAA